MTSPPRSDPLATATVLVAGVAVAVQGLALLHTALGLLVVPFVLDDAWDLVVDRSDLALAGLVTMLRLVLLGAAVAAVVVAARSRDRSSDRRIRSAMAVSVLVLLLGVLPFGLLPVGR